MKSPTLLLIGRLTKFWVFVSLTVCISFFLLLFASRSLPLAVALFLYKYVSTPASFFVVVVALVWLRRQIDCDRCWSFFSSLLFRCRFSLAITHSVHPRYVPHMLDTIKFRSHPTSLPTRPLRFPVAEKTRRLILVDTCIIRCRLWICLAGYIGLPS